MEGKRRLVVSQDTPGEQHGARRIQDVPSVPIVPELFQHEAPERMPLRAGDASVEQEHRQAARREVHPPVVAGLLAQHDAVFASQQLQTADTVGVEIGVYAAELLHDQIPRRIGAVDGVRIGPVDRQEIREAFGDQTLQRVVGPQAPLPVRVALLPGARPLGKLGRQVGTGPCLVNNSGNHRRVFLPW